MSISISGNFDDVISSAYTSAVKTVNGTPILAATSTANLSNRQVLTIFNDSLNTIYYGPAGVTSSGANKGIPVEPDEVLVLATGEGINVFLASAGPDSSVIIQEFA